MATTRNCLLIFTFYTLTLFLRYVLIYISLALSQEWRLRWSSRDWPPGPIWITEFDVATVRMPWTVKRVGPLLRELHSHPYVDGLIMWSNVRPNVSGPGFGCFMMCYTDEHYKNQPVGDVIDGFTRDFIRVPDYNGETDDAGVFEASLFHGEYEATVTLPDGGQPPPPQVFSLMPVREGTVVRF
ncbi:hypothetical protein SASPL_151800 [Salvia splendens]|uniref:Uncharacterized protein n=1 Tax=Salvia splendens TaxID=180675 RepID=A0A8X8W1Z8_SALSN|nr:hypothetical protein SASPL_151800 [Salvia splendens]